MTWSILITVITTILGNPVALPPTPDTVHKFELPIKDFQFVDRDACMNFRINDERFRDFLFKMERSMESHFPAGSKTVASSTCTAHGQPI